MQIGKKSFSLYKSRKGGIEITFSELIGAIAFAFLLAAFIYISVKLSGIFLSNKDYDSTIKSFELLDERIRQLTSDKNFANTNLLYFLDPGYILVGYNYKDNLVQMRSCKGESLIGSREKIGTLCSGSCLCIYKNTYGNDFDKDIEGPQMPLQCKSFAKNVVFLAPSEQNSIFCGAKTGWNPNIYADYYKSGSYQFLVTRDFNTREIYIDKYESKDGIVFIFMAEYKNEPSHPIYVRKRFMEENYEKFK